MPTKRTSHGTTPSSYRLLGGISLLATPPTGVIYLFDVPPHTKQYKSDTYEEDTTSLKNLISENLEPIIEKLKAQESDFQGGIALKVVFIFGKNESEKDLDNMLKWFMDCLKEAVSVDDSLVSDIRALKYREEHREKGLMGITIRTLDWNPANPTDSWLAQQRVIGHLKAKNPGLKALKMDKVIQNIGLVQDQFRDSFIGLISKDY